MKMIMIQVILYDDDKNRKECFILKESHKSIFDSKTYVLDVFAPSLLVNYSPCSIRVG